MHAGGTARAIEAEVCSHSARPCSEESDAAHLSKKRLQCVAARSDLRQGDQVDEDRGELLLIRRPRGGLDRP